MRSKILALGFLGAIVVSFLLFAPMAMLAFGVVNRRQYAVSVGHFFFRVALPLFGLKPQVEGAFNIPKDRNFVVLCNHQSFLDIGVVLSLIQPLAWLAKIELFRIPIFGFALRFIGCLPVDRGNRNANRDLARELRHNLSKGFNYCVYPEGTRSIHGELLPFKNGIFRIIQNAPVPVLPITVIGTGQIMPKTRLGLFPSRPRLVIHPLIEPEQIEKWNLEEFKSAVRVRIEEGLRLGQEQPSEEK